VGFYELNDNFRESFTPDGAILKPELGELYLSFKTQMYLSAVQEEEQERAKEDILEDLFPDRIDEALAARYPEQSLLDKEMEFVKMVKARREYLMNQPDDIESIRSSFSSQHAVFSLPYNRGSVKKVQLGGLPTKSDCTPE